MRIARIRQPQVRALILQGKAEEAEALAAQFLIEPQCCEQTLNIFRSEALRLSGRFEEAARAADKAISIFRAKGGGLSSGLGCWPSAGWPNWSRGVRRRHSLRSSKRCLC